jgi:DNA replication protein DnaC
MTESISQVLSPITARQRSGGIGRDPKAYALVAAAHEVDVTDRLAHADALIEATDRAEQLARKALQVAHRTAAYARRRPSRYAEASYELLSEHQRQNGKIARWWDTGPRAVVLAGPARTGKTTAGYAIANAVQAQGVWTVTWSVADLSAALKPDSGEPFAYEYAIKSDLLMLDDRGRERVTDWWLEQLQRIVDSRCANGRRTIITTNHGTSIDDVYDELAKRYGYPVVERMIDDGAILYFDGPPVRRVISEW